MSRFSIPSFVFVSVVMAQSWAMAAHTHFVTLEELNNSGVRGGVELTLDESANTLTVHLTATGLEAGQLHPQHIHGLVDDEGNPVESTVPPPAVADDDESGDDDLIEIGEGLPFYGPVILPLDPFPTLGDDETMVDFEQTFDLSDPDGDVFNGDFTRDQLLPLDQRVIVLHGLTVDGNYVTSLPVAAGEIQIIPEPATFGLLALGGLAMAGRRRRDNA